MTPEHADPLLAALAELPGPGTSPVRDLRVRARCHAALTSRAAAGPGGRELWARVLDALLPVAAVLYGIATLAEVVRIVYSIG